MTKQWNEMSKAEKNLAIADLLGEDYIMIPDFDYRDWRKLMPLIVEHGIDLCCLDDVWSADYYDADYAIRGINKNPQEALAECLWMVLKEKGDD